MKNVVIVELFFIRPINKCHLYFDFGVYIIFIFSNNPYCLFQVFNLGLQHKFTSTKNLRTMAAIPFQSMSSEEANKFFDSFDTVLTDCDGES